VRLTPLFTAAVLVAVLAGCTSSPDPSPGRSAVPAPTFTEPARYGFVLDRKCGDGPSLGRYRVIVQDGEVVTADRIDGKTAQGEEEIDVPTLSGLLSLAQTAADDGGAVTSKVDPRDGHPTSVSVDVSDEDGPSCFVISDYAPAP
jgi:hypothetical protein